MKWTRRSTLLAGAASAALFLSGGIAQAFIASSAGAGGGGTQLTSIMLSETAGNTIPANFIAPNLGHPFKKGDVASGRYPYFYTAGNLSVPYTMYNAVYWADGSLKHASFLLRPQVGIAANGSLTVNIGTTASSPGSSSRSTSDLTAADLRLAAVGLDNLSGTWTSILNDGVSGTNQSFSGPDIVSYTDGAVGRVYRIRASFEQSGAAHGQMECYWYVAVLQNAAGGLYGIRYLGRLTQPWYNSTNSPTRTFRSFSALQTLSGAVQQRDLFATYLQPQTITRSSGNQFNADTTYLQSCMAVQLSTSGVMPTGLSAATTYWINRVSAGKVQFCTAAQPSAVGNAVVTVSDAGTGTLTLTPIAYCCMFGSLWTSGSTATWDYIQGGGSIASDATVRCSMNKTYWRSTKMMPSYDLSVSPTSNTAQIMFPGWGGPVERANSTTGERDDIGVFPAWYARHFLTQAAVDEQVVRVVGLVQGLWSFHLRDTTTKSLPVGNGNTYSGMPAANASFRWDPQGGGGSNVTGFTIPSNNQCLSCFNNQDTQHMPAFSYYPYLLTGEPQFLDLNAELANNALINRLNQSGTAVVSGSQNALVGKRTVTISGVTRTGILLDGSAALRSDAWALRDMAAAAAMQTGNPENASYGTYFGDLNTDNWAAAQAFNGIETSFWLSSGFMGYGGVKPEGQCTQGNWQQGYWTYSNALAAAITENADALSFLSHPVKLFSFIRTNFGCAAVGSYQYVYRSTDANDGPAITTVPQFALWGSNTSWTSGGHFTVTPQNGYVLTVNDVYIFVSEEGGIPGNFTAVTPYYVVNVGVAGANTFDLSATLGGSPIVPNTSSSTAPAFIGFANHPATGFNSADTNDGYGANISGAMQYAQAVGATVDTACISDMLARMAGDGVTFTSNPKYGMTSSF